MGEVYRATDGNLKRSVAIKVLPASVAGDGDRLARFQREAEVLAALNHPNIAAIYGLEKTADFTALVMELVEGDDLSQRIARGPIPLAEALPIAKQIAEALEAAHEQGIIHRDLKPANIKVRADGTVKVLDFGLARIDVSPGAVLSHSPTVIGVSSTGTLLGTAGYMSPEQARGQSIDKRSDVWAFGCVLYEMLTGRRAFAGDNASDTIAAVLRSEPDWSVLPADVPSAIQALVRRSLQKDRMRRIADLSTASFLLSEPDLVVTPQSTSPSALAHRSLIQRVFLIAIPSLIAGVVIAGATTSWWAKRPITTDAVRFVIAVPAAQRFTNLGRQIVAISPDGRQLIYAANEQLYLRSTGEFEAKPIVGTAASGGVNNPVFSPDSKWVAFYSLAEKAIKRIPVAGGAAVTLAVADNPFGVSWGTQGFLFGQGGFGQGGKGIMRVSEAGGKPDVIVRLNGDEVPYGPQMLPGGDWVLLSIAAAGTDPERWNRARIVAYSPKSSERKVLIEGGSDARYVRTGHLIYARAGTVFAVPFDSQRLEVKGVPVPVLEGVRRSAGNQTGAAQFTVSDTGTVMYLPGPVSASSLRDLAFVDRTGRVDALKMPPATYDFPRISPDGRLVAMSTDDGTEAIVWICEITSPRSLRRLSFGGRNRFPIWSADGQRVVYQSDRDGTLGLWWQRADGTGAAERLTLPEHGTSQIPESWSPKEESFLYSATNGSAISVWLFSLRDRKTALYGELQTTTARPFNPVFSPDGRWVAYQSYDAGSVNVYVQPFPATGAKYEIAAVAWAPLWSPDAKELFYANSNQLASVRVMPQPTFTIGPPTVVTQLGTFAANAAYAPRSHDITRDRRHFLAVVDADQAAGAPPTEIHVALNWQEELKQRVPTR